MCKHKPGVLFLVLMVIFFVPLLTAWYLFSHHPNWIFKTTNNGIFVRPVLSIRNLPLSEYNFNDSFNTKAWQGNWVLLYIKANNCDQSCLRMLYEIKQIQKASGKYQDKILTAYVAVSPNMMSNPSAEIFREFPQTLLLKTSQTHLISLLKNIFPTSLVLQQGQLFLVDPNGYIMMRYPNNVNPEDVLHDLDHLLGIENI